jgi:hypothetical protein
MITKLDRDFVQAELAGLDALLESLPANDYLGRMGLQSRRTRLREQLAALADRAERRAQIALYFGGDPVIGSLGVQAEFATTTLNNFQDLITKVWASGENGLAAMGPIPDKAAAQLHITNLVHGSFGFMLEELDERGEPLFETPLRQAADRAVGYIASFAGEDENAFNAVIEDIDRRVFKAIRDFFSVVYKGRATVRIVEGDIDEKFDRVALERAWVRVEAADVDEDNLEMQGRLLGVIPIGRRFEFESGDRIIKGTVGEQLSQSYLERMANEQFAGKRWNAKFHRKIVTQTGREPTEKFILLDLAVIEEPPA